jgi:integrase
MMSGTTISMWALSFLLYECVSYNKGVLAYDRAKTRDRRNDNAHIEIVVPDIIKPLFRKYKGTTRVFDFYQKYSNEANFNKHINKGLHFIADELGIPRFDFYSARHTWASIARNKLGIDKYTIHEALNHVSQLDVTDIYIQKDFTNINKANEKVVEYVTELIKKTKNDA